MTAEVRAKVMYTFEQSYWLLITGNASPYTGIIDVSDIERKDSGIQFSLCRKAAISVNPISQIFPNPTALQNLSQVRWRIAWACAFTFPHTALQLLLDPPYPPTTCRNVLPSTNALKSTSPHLLMSKRKCILPIHISALYSSFTISISHFASEGDNLSKLINILQLPNVLESPLFPLLHDYTFLCCGSKHTYKYTGHGQSFNAVLTLPSLLLYSTPPPIN